MRVLTLDELEYVSGGDGDWASIGIGDMSYAFGGYADGASAGSFTDAAGESVTWSADAQNITITAPDLGGSNTIPLADNTQLSSPNSAGFDLGFQDLTLGGWSGVMGGIGGGATTLIIASPGGAALLGAELGGEAGAFAGPLGALAGVGLGTVVGLAAYAYVSRGGFGGSSGPKPSQP